MLTATYLPSFESSRARPRITSSQLEVHPPPWMMTTHGRFIAPLGENTSYLSSFTPGLAYTTLLITLIRSTADFSINEAPTARFWLTVSLTSAVGNSLLLPRPPE